jgi:ATP-dependent helicase/DNAse subunit B
MTAARLYLAQTIDVALDDAARRIAAGKREDPLAPAALLLPTLDSVAYARQRLGDSAGIQLFVFPALARAILLQTGAATRELSGTALRRLVRRLLAGMKDKGELTTFGIVHDKAGFRQVLLEWRPKHLQPARGVA